MANDGPQPVNIDTSYLYRQMMQGGGGGAVFGIFQDVDLSRALGAKGMAIKSEATFACRAPKKPGIFAKLLQDAGLTVAGLSESLQKVAQAGAVQQVNSIADIAGQPGLVGSSGGSFASLVGGSNSSGGGDISIS